MRNIKILWIKASESYLVVTLLKLQNNSLVSPWWDTREHTCYPHPGELCDVTSGRSHVCWLWSSSNHSPTLYHVSRVPHVEARNIRDLAIKVRSWSFSKSISWRPHDFHYKQANNIWPVRAQTGQTDSQATSKSICRHHDDLAAKWQTGADQNSVCTPQICGTFNYNTLASWLVIWTKETSITRVDFIGVPPENIQNV